MENHLEAKFILNGIESWIHCLDMKVGISKPDRKLSYHYHDYVEFLYSLESDGQVYINGKVYKFTDGDLIIINSNDMHDLIFSKASRYICVKFSPNILYADEQAYTEYKYAMPFLIDSIHQTVFSKEETEQSGIGKLCIEIIEEWKQMDYAYELVIRANILKIFSWILRYWKKNGITNMDKNLPDTIKKAIIYISDNYENVTESEAAKECGLSYNHFSSVFKEYMGQSFKHFLISVRLKKAERLLLTTDKSITEIAVETGFTTASHFIENFKRYKAMTPNKFRKTLKNI